MSRKAIGIDLGSTMSEVAVIEGGEPKVMLTTEGSRTFPSVVVIDKKTGERKVGAPAKRQAIMNPKNTINLVKRFMGRKFDDPEVIEAKKHIQYDIVNHNGWAYIQIDGKEYSPQQISSWILAELKKMAEDYTGETITDAVITVPAMFPDSARTATKEAGELAGLNVLRIINEPTAATLASKLEKSGVYVVCDFGGSTLDNSVMEFDTESNTIEILASNGDTFLGGADLDNEVAKYVCDEFKSSNGIDLKKDSMAMQRVMEAVEKAKIELSSSTQTEINLPYITAVDGVPQHLVMTLSKAKFENLIAPYVDRVINSAKDALKAADKTGELDGIIIVGGSCRIPYIQERLEKELGAPLLKKAELDLAVAQGASIQANILAGNYSSTDMVLLDVTPLSLGIEVQGGMMAKLIDANTTIPTSKTETFSTAADNQTSVNIVIAQGERARIQDNKIIGQFILDGIMPAPRGVPQIDVTFDIDASGIVTVSAKDKATGKEQKVTIQNSTSLSKEEIERIKADAELHKAEDEAKKKEMTIINSTESKVYGIENALKSAGDKVSEDDKKAVETKILEVKKVLDTKVVADIEKASKELDDVWNPVVAKIYGGGSSTNGSNPFGDFAGGNGGFDFNDMMNNMKNAAGNSSTQNTDSTDNSQTESSEVDFEEVK